MYVNPAKEVNTRMGEAKRRKLAGNTAPNKKWHADKAARKRAKKLAAQERANNRILYPALQK